MGTGPVTQETVTSAALVAWFRRFSVTIEGRADELSALDAAIGDADHGTNLRRGCRAVVQALDTQRPADVAAFGRAVAMSLISAVGGASGPLYGSFFLAFANHAGTDDELTPDGLVAAWRAGVEGVASRGKAEPGDKTMLDALGPAVDAMADAVEQGVPLSEVFASAVAAAEHGMRATIPMQARKGRASYLGERSIGHQDPGATSSWMLVQAAAETMSSVPRH